MNPLVLILQQFIAALGNTVVRAPSRDRLDECVPVQIDFEIQFDADPNLLRPGVQSYLDEVRARWADPVTQNLRPLLDASRAAHDQMGSQSVKWNTALTGKPTSKYYHRVSLDQQDVTLALDLVQQAPNAAMDSLFASKQDLIEGLTQLRRLDDMMIRVRAARAAADATGCTMAEVLALYRTEGNLVAPRSHQSLVDGIPPFEPVDDFEPTKMVDHNVSESPSIASRVFLHKRTFFGTDEDLLRRYALMVWMVQIAGLDIVAKKGIDAFANFFAEWSAQNWNQHTGTAVTPDSRLAAMNDLLSDLVVETVSRDGSGNLVAATSMAGATDFVRVSPRDPEKLLSTVLADACLFLRRGGKPRRLNDPEADPPGFPAGWIAPPRLTYALYNLQVGTPAGSPKEAFLMSALVYANRTRGAKFKPLRDEIAKDTAFRDKLRDDITSAVRKHKVVGPTLVAAHFPTVRQWLLDQTDGKKRIELLTGFIEKANKRDWPSWDAPEANGKDRKGVNSYRANANRYHLLYVYFHLLTSEVPPF